ncbi:AtaL-like protein [Pigmentiphaga litoralis]|uniref:AtaL-like protein n=1 Tax=Pigmentiphaga litoralis TaxID=516702 RepID=UPI003B42BF32
MLTFEHLVQINDPRVPLIQPLTRMDIWHGLVLRAHHPTEFIMGLEGCVIETQEEQGRQTLLTRVLDFGPFQVHDRVTLTPMHEVRVLALATDRWPRSEATVTVEEPEEGAIFLRFTYELDLADDSDDMDETTVEIRKQAYVAADLDTVKRIREIAAIRKAH